MNIENYLLKDFIYLSNETLEKYESVLFALMPKNEFCKKSFDVNTMPYIDTRYCIKLLSTGRDWNALKELFVLCFGIKEKEFWNTKIIEFYHARKYLVIEWQRIILKENEMLKSTINTDADKWKMAGVERLNAYNDIIGIDAIAKRYNLYPFDLSLKPYSEIFYLQNMIKTDNEINYNFQNIK